MKTKYFILPLFLTLFLQSFGQQQSYFYDASLHNAGFSYNITISYTLISEWSKVRPSEIYKVKLISVTPDSRGYFYTHSDKKFWSCSELGNPCNPNNWRDVFVDIGGQCKYAITKKLWFKKINQEEIIEYWIEEGKTCSFNIITGMVADGQYMDLHRIINAKLQAEKSKIDQNKSDNNSQNPVTSSGTQTNSSQPQNTGIPANTSGNDPLVNYNNSPTTTQTTTSNLSETKANPVQIPDDYKGNPLNYNKANTGSNAVDDFNKGYQQGQQIVDVATGIVDLFTATPEQLQRRAEVQRLTEERNARITKSCKTYLEAQIGVYLPAAQKGDENARMKLCQEFSSVARGQCLDLFYLIPDHKSWLKQAAANKNFYAINYIGISSVFNGPYGFPLFGITVDQGIAMMDESVNMGNTDAMLLLGTYYSRKKKSPFFGGANAIKSIYYFEKGAKMGNVDCLYSLGMIYRHNYVNEATNIKFKIEKNDTTAFNYFSTAIISRYNEDSEIIKPHRQSVTYCIVCSDILKKSYYELSMMYEKGIGCKMDKEIARKLKEEYEKK
jgi:hypothetical protein